jgi:hypothetical protein
MWQVEVPIIINMVAGLANLHPSTPTWASIIAEATDIPRGNPSRLLHFAFKAPAGFPGAIICPAILFA